MGRIFEPARFPSASSPEVRTLDFASGQDFLKGAVLIFDGSQDLIEASDHPETGIVGVALESPGSKPGFSTNFDDLVVARTGTVEKVSVALANRLTTFMGRMISSSDDPLTPTTADIGTEFGISPTASGEWVIDHDETTDVAVIVTGIDLDSNLVFFKFLESSLAIP